MLVGRRICGRLGVDGVGGGRGAVAGGGGGAGPAAFAGPGFAGAGFATAREDLGALGRRTGGNRPFSWDDGLPPHRQRGPSPFKGKPVHRQGWRAFHPKYNPVHFITFFAMGSLTVFSIWSLGSGESLPQRKRRASVERVYAEYGLTESEIDEIEALPGEFAADFSDKDAAAYGKAMDEVLEPSHRRHIMSPYARRELENMEAAAETQHSAHMSRPMAALRQERMLRRIGIPADVLDQPSDEELLERLAPKKSLPLGHPLVNYPGETADVDVKLGNRR